MSKSEMKLHNGNGEAMQFMVRPAANGGFAVYAFDTRVAFGEGILVGAFSDASALVKGINEALHPVLSSAEVSK